MVFLSAKTHLIENYLKNGSSDIDSLEKYYLAGGSLDAATKAFQGELTKSKDPNSLKMRFLHCIHAKEAYYESTLCGKIAKVLNDIFQAIGCRGSVKVAYEILMGPREVIFCDSSGNPLSEKELEQELANQPIYSIQETLISARLKAAKSPSADDISFSPNQIEKVHNKENPSLAEPILCGFERSKVLTDQYLVNLAQKKGNQITSLDLENAESITDEGLIAIAKRAPKLKYVNLEGCKKITQKGVDALAKHCPEVTYFKASHLNPQPFLRQGGNLERIGSAGIYSIFNP